VMRRPEILRHVSIGLRGKRVLVIDDVADTGHSLQLVVRYVRKRGAEKVMTCTLHYKPWAIIKPDYFLTETKAWSFFSKRMNCHLTTPMFSLTWRLLAWPRISNKPGLMRNRRCLLTPEMTLPGKY